MTAFPIHRVDRARAEAPEQLGSKPKFWCREGERRLLFKADDRGTGEDWAEVIARHLCALLGVPHVEYELAQEFDAGVAVRPGVICENMAASGVYLALGNEMLLSLDPQYPTQQRFKVRQHTVEAVASIMSALEPPTPDWATNIPAGVESALDVFVGYAMLDAWIANQDRPHEKWAEAPCTNERQRAVVAFAERGRSSFYATGADPRSMGRLEAFMAFGDRSP